jgi:hypothetical protein
MSILVVSPFGTILGLKAISTNEGKSNKNYQITDKCGKVAKADTIDTLKKPTCTYSVESDFDLSQIILGGKLGSKVVSNVAITTSAGTPPSVTISGDDFGSATCVDETQQIALSGTIKPDNCAQAIGDTPDSIGTVHLQSCSATYSVTINPIPGSDGKTAKYGVAKGQCDINAEYQATDSTIPSLPTATDTLEITNPMTAAADTTTLPKYSLGFVKHL